MDRPAKTDTSYLQASPAAKRLKLRKIKNVLVVVKLQSRFGRFKSLAILLLRVSISLSRNFYNQDVEDKPDYDEFGGEEDEDDYDSKFYEEENEEENVFDLLSRKRRYKDSETGLSGEGSAFHRVG